MSRDIWGLCASASSATELGMKPHSLVRWAALSPLTRAPGQVKGGQVPPIPRNTRAVLLSAGCMAHQIQRLGLHVPGKPLGGVMGSLPLPGDWLHPGHKARGPGEQVSWGRDLGGDSPRVSPPRSGSPPLHSGVAPTDEALPLFPGKPVVPCGLVSLRTRVGKVTRHRGSAEMGSEGEPLRADGGGRPGTERLWVAGGFWMQQVGVC